MKSKKLLSILITVCFFVACIVSAIFIFTVKKVDCEFSLINRDGVEVQKVLDKRVGENLLFFNTDVIVKEVEKDPYLNVVEVKKEFPNVLKVKVVERKEVYLIDYNEKTYILDETGFVLSELTDDRKNSSDFDERRFVKIYFEDFDFPNDLEINVISIGKKVVTNDDGAFYTALEMAEVAGVSDCIKSMNVLVNIDHKDVLFDTYTGVTIQVKDVDRNAIAKTDAAFSAYVNDDSDYIKTFDLLMALEKDENGQTVVSVQWTSRGA